MFMIFYILNLYIGSEYIVNGYKIIYLDLISLIAILSGVLVIVSKNPIISVLFLIGLFLGVSIYLIFLGLNFIGLSYLLVYIGAISILFLFILMLINVRVSELSTDTNNSLPLILIINISLYIFISKVMVQINEKISTKKENVINMMVDNNRTEALSIKTDITVNTEKFEVLTHITPQENQIIKLSNSHFFNYLDDLFNTKIKYITSFMWDGNLAEYSHIASIGNIMYSSYSIWLILTSIILLLAMVGSIVITIKQKN